MSSMHLSKVVGQRGKTSLDIERDNFEKRQTVALTKAINSQEIPVKEKHARNAVLGTFQDNGGNMFWAIASKMPVQANPIVCWKFLHMVHKVMRDGHQNVVQDSLRFSSQIRDVGKLWGHLKEGYGRLIAHYCRLIIQKLKFHKKFPGIPGNLVLTDAHYYKICGSDVNNYFEFSIDMLDYMDEILSLQHAVFGSLDMSRANSMTTSGQCRLAPIICCILDSCQLYDYLVKSLFHLHSIGFQSLGPDTLTGHRDRFLQCYRKLKEFYYKCSNLQYFKHLVQVPSLPDDPPNFLVASDLSKHVKPAAVVHQEPEPEPEPEDSVDNLIDISAAEEPPAQANGRPPELDERDFLIERLQREIQMLKEELQRMKSEDQMVIGGLKDEISKLEKILSELRLSANKSLKENDSLKKEVEQLRIDAASAFKISDAEKQAKASQEKFQKMKDIYGKLREEHVTLLRNHDSLNKQLATEKKNAEEKEQIIKKAAGDLEMPSQSESKLELNRMQEEKQLVQNNLQKSADDVTQQLAEVTSFNSKLEAQKETSGVDAFYAGWNKSQDLEGRVKVLEGSKSQLESDLDQKMSELTSLTNQLSLSSDQAKEKEQELTEANEALTSQLQQTKEEKEEMEIRLCGRMEEMENKLSEVETDKDRLQGELAQQMAALNDRLQQSEREREKLGAGLRNEIETLRKRMLLVSVREACAMISDAVEQGENPAFAATTCTADYLMSRADPVMSSLTKLQTSSAHYSVDGVGLESVIGAVTELGHSLSDCIVQGFATSHSAQIEPGEELANTCRSCGKKGKELLEIVEQGNNAETQAKQVEEVIQEILRLAEGLVPKMEDVKAEEIGDLLEKEMQGMTTAIESAAGKIEEMLNKSRQDNTGVNLEVNESILGSCTELMKAIKILVEKSRDLQKEIISSGRGTTSDKEFYKKNHRWTEGLLSAAKAVGWGATTLLDTADRVVNGKAKFEEIMAVANEIAASTAQLVVSSKVKAARESRLLSELSKASKGVNQATGNVVASAKTAVQIVEDQSLMDFSQLSLHQTKKLEMQSQIRLMELEVEVDRERRKLGDLRKQHYTLAGESEGWEVNSDGELMMDDSAHLESAQDKK